MYLLAINLCREAHQSNSSIQDNGKDTDIVEDLEEEFLNLDDVPGETKCKDEIIQNKLS